MLEDKKYGNYTEYGKKSVFIDRVGIGHSTFQKLLNYDGRRNNGITVDVILKIIIFWGTNLEDSKKLIRLFLYLDLDANTEYANNIKALVEWIDKEGKKYDHAERLFYATDFLQKNEMNITLERRD